ncbi:hypothetical protein RJ640_027789 [Escallonia rubra]|uniref:Uncharacterized protein n=1 Tax=Escallonia rubra TaxID=112253 RepID=A0AA88RBC5_9ASTE|nr:hypothetical protein RJ640_027789 [Escallonia rubra]
MAGQGMDQFEAYFRRADLDQDGRISGAEAVGFFKGSNLPQQVLAQIWTHADQNRTGFLGRAEFYNALKLVTVAQSKRDLTPDIVKAALYGPASAKIPAPQINIAATPTPQAYIRSGAPTPQLSSAAPTASQSTGMRGPQSFPSQQNQFMRPPRPPAPSTAFASQGMPASRPPSSSIATDPLGGRPGGLSLGVTSQLPARGVSPSAPQDGFGLAASRLMPLSQPRPQATTALTQPAAPKPNDPTVPAHQVGPKDPKALPGNGFVSDQIFGDVFSATPSQAQQNSLAPLSAAGALPVSSATVSASAGPQHSDKPSPFESLHNAMQPTGRQHQPVQSTAKQNHQVPVQSSSAFPGGAGNPAGPSQPPWPRMTQSDFQKYSKVFVEVDTDRDGKITGQQASNLFLSWRLPREVLKQVWDLSDQDNDSMLSLREFCIALYFMERYREGRPLPPVLPSGIMFEETLSPASGQLAAPHGNATWRPTSGLQQAQSTAGARPVTTAAGGRPPRPVPIPQPEEAVPTTQQRPRVPVLEKHFMNQLSTEEQNALNSKFQEATEADKKVEELEKEITESREKIDFYRSKMQELTSMGPLKVIVKDFHLLLGKLEGVACPTNSHKKKYGLCDNRLNEITERVSTDKREVETLAKKYEEKYKQVGDVASKLTIEEATFRDIQEKKMDLYKAIVKLEQDGGTDGIQVGNLAFKKEQLIGMKIGISLKMKNDLDIRFLGFTFVKELTLDVQNVIAPPKLKPSLVPNEPTSREEGESAVSSSNADGKSENIQGAGEKTPEDELANGQSEGRVARSPPDSPARSPSKIFVDSPSKKNINADGSPHRQGEHGGTDSVLSGDRSFDEPGWGTFETQYDSDANWDFNRVTTKHDGGDNWARMYGLLKQAVFLYLSVMDSLYGLFSTVELQDDDREKHAENSFFGPDDWGLNPIRTESTRSDNMFQNKSRFAFDSVPSTPNFSGSSPPADNMFQRKSPFAFTDSVPSTPNFSGSSPPADNMFQRRSPFAFADSVPSTPMSEEHSFDNFSRFDSFSTHDGGLFPPRESLTRFDSMGSTNDSEYDHGFFPPHDSSLARFDSFRSTADSEYGLFPPRDSFARFDSIRSTRDSDYGHGFPSFDDKDPFGSSDPFKTSLESQTPRRDSDSWRPF